MFHVVKKPNKTKNQPQWQQNQGVYYSDYSFLYNNISTERTSLKFMHGSETPVQSSPVTFGGEKKKTQERRARNFYQE